MWLVQVRPGGLAAFPVDVTVATGGMAVEEEGLILLVEVVRGAKPSPAEIEGLISFIRATVCSSLPARPWLAHHVNGLPEMIR